MRNRLIWTLALVVVASLAFTAVAEAHTLSKRRAARATAQVAQGIGEEGVRDPETPWVAFDYALVPCERATAHRVVCGMAIAYFVPESAEPHTVCSAVAIVGLRRHSNRIKVRVPESRIKCE